MNMKYIKLCSILFTITLLTTASNCLDTHNTQNGVYALKTNKDLVKQDSKTEAKETDSEKLVVSKKPDIASNKALSDEDLKMLFPDANFRNVITRNFKHQEITLDKIAALSGEFYATGEGIESLEGISYLKNIQNFVFVNNNIKELPSEILNLKNIKNINLLNNYITDNSVLNKLIKKGMEIDLGGIAKGYAADQIVKYLKSKDVESAIINLGGNVFILGEKEKNTPFKVGIQDPTSEDGSSIGNISVSNKSVVTSGIYERYLEKDGIIYHHMIDPSTGYPFENNLSSVTIISSSSIVGDGLSTTTFGLGLQKGMKLIESLDNTDAIFITKDKKVYTTSNLKGKLNLKNESFKLMN